MFYKIFKQLRHFRVSLNTTLFSLLESYFPWTPNIQHSISNWWRTGINLDIGYFPQPRDPALRDALLDIQFKPSQIHFGQPTRSFWTHPMQDCFARVSDGRLRNFLTIYIFVILDPAAAGDTAWAGEYRSLSNNSETLESRWTQRF